MGKAIMLALCLGVANARAGLESIIEDGRCIKSETCGELAIPKKMGESYIKQIILLGKLSAAMADSPYQYGTDNQNKIFFYDRNGSTSRVDFVKDYQTPNGFKKEVLLSGTRTNPTINFEAGMILDFEQKENKLEYTTTMYTLIKERWKRWLTKGIRWVSPETTEKYFEKEQDSVIQMMNKLIYKMKRNPREFLQTVRKGTNGVYFTKQEINYIENSMKENEFLK
jgi:hypothetical protein